MSKDGFESLSTAAGACVIGISFASGVAVLLVAGGFDASKVSASDFFTLLIGLAALAVALRALIATIDGNRRVSVDTFHDLVDRFDAMKELRSRIATNFLAGDPPPAGMTNVLNHFEYIGWCVKRGYVDLDAVWTWVGDRAQAYWFAFEPVIGAWTAQDATYYEDWRALVARLQQESDARGANTFRTERERFGLLRTMQLEEELVARS